jgi:hypothetical protein
MQVVGDGTMVKGWEKALRTMTVGERAIVRVIDPSLGYGAAGVPPLIPPNAALEFDIEILDTQLPTENIDFDSIATADSTPVRKETIHCVRCASFCDDGWAPSSLRTLASQSSLAECPLSLLLAFFSCSSENGSGN